MKNYLRFPIAQLLLIFLPLMASAEESCHPPETQVEQILDHILQTSNRSFDLVDYVLGKIPNSTKYQQLFTPAFRNYMTAQETDMVKENCSGKYTGEICGFDYNPITCSQDPPDTYIYRTIEQTSQRALIAAGVARSHYPTATYHMVKHNGHWQMDGVDCGEGTSFNMPVSNKQDIDK